MGVWDYVFIIGSIFVFVFVAVMDVLLLREWLQKRRDRQKNAGPPKK